MLSRNELLMMVWLCFVGVSSVLGRICTFDISVNLVDVLWTIQKNPW